jgi:hypothetical protein
MSVQLMVIGDFHPLQVPGPAVRLVLGAGRLAASPAAAKAARIGAGLGMGTAFGAACGNPGFWISVGLGLGWLLARLREAG